MQVQPLQYLRSQGTISGWSMVDQLERKLTSAPTVLMLMRFLGLLGIVNAEYWPNDERTNKVSCQRRGHHQYQVHYGQFH